MCVHSGECEGAAKNKMYVQSRETGWGAAQKVQEQTSIRGAPWIKRLAPSWDTRMEVVRGKKLAAESQSQG